MQRRQFIAGSLATIPLLTLQGCEPSIKRQLAHIQGGFTGVNVERGHQLRDAKTWPAPATTQKTKVIIAGGGVAGLAAARALRLQGMNDFVMLELEDSAGGNSKGGSVGGIACPLGAHYLPVPRDDAVASRHVRDVQNLLEELGVRQRVAGRWTYDERYLCHSPQERLFFNGHWQDGLLPVQDVSAHTLAQYRQFEALVETARKTSQWSIPASNSSLAGEYIKLLAIPFASYLDQHQLTDPHLRWYLDYCCRDDYGAGIATVSAWAGIHYFASRHGFHAPETSAVEKADRDSVLTWPEGNGWLTQRMAQPLGERLLTKRIVTRIEESKHGVEVDALDTSTLQMVRWQAEHCIVTLPIFIAAKVIQSPPTALQTAAKQTLYAPWLVANIHINQALHDRTGAAPSWDNVLYGTAGLGYVDAKHQSFDRVPSATVLTYYRALGDLPNGRKQLLEQTWGTWRNAIVSELSAAHPDLASKATRIDITRYGHAMAIPTPIKTSLISNQINLKNRFEPVYSLPSSLQFLNKKSNSSKSPQRLLFAHSDWASYSVFEEAFALGHAAGNLLAT